MFGWTINWLVVKLIFWFLILLMPLIWYIRYKIHMWITEKEGYYWEKGRRKYLREIRERRYERDGRE